MGGDFFVGFCGGIYVLYNTDARITGADNTNVTENMEGDAT